MLITIIGGRLEDSERLSLLGAAAGVQLEFHHRFLTGATAGTAEGGARKGADLWSERGLLARPLALVFEAKDQPELAAKVLRGVREEAYFDDTFALIAIPFERVSLLEPSGGFDDFVLHPFTLDELYSRVRLLLWRRSGSGAPKRYKAGNLSVDKVAHEVRVEGTLVPLTAKEFALLAYLSEEPGRVFSREQILSRVWGTRYVGGPRTVDIHVRRLRAKLGAALPLDTLRGAGYRLRSEWTEGQLHALGAEQRKSA
ncbi:MAG TPA: response regulator transcription factor [Polyangiaceae bacterium]|nr:response regulator transcription factor [Polyangiaceae bacterium]